MTYKPYLTGKKYDQEQPVDIISQDPLNPHVGLLNRSIIVTRSFFKMYPQVYYLMPISASNQQIFFN